MKRELRDGRRTPTHHEVLAAVVNRMTGREFREWYADRRPIRDREFYEGRP